MLKAVRETLKDGVANPAGKVSVEILVKDSQSNPNRAAEVAGELILQNNIDLMVVGATPENSNPVCDQCELNGVPCISTTTPWQPWFFGRGGDPAKGFDWTYHYFWGLEDIIEVFTSIWNQVPTNKVVGLFLANDGDGNAWGDAKLGLPPALTKMGFTVIDPGRFQPFQADYSAQIAAYKKANVEIVAGVPTPPDFKNFWTQARQQGFHPKAVTMGKAISFPYDHGRARRNRRRAYPGVVVDARPRRSSLRSPGSLRRSSRKAMRRRCTANGMARSAMSIRCSRWPPTSLSARRIRPTKRRCATRSSRPISKRSRVPSPGPASR